MVNQFLTKYHDLTETFQSNINLLFLSLPNPPNKKQKSCEFHKSVLIHKYGAHYKYAKNVYFTQRILNISDMPKGVSDAIILPE